MAEAVEVRAAMESDEEKNHTRIDESTDDVGINIFFHIRLPSLDVDGLRSCIGQPPARSPFVSLPA